MTLPSLRSLSTRRSNPCIFTHCLTFNPFRPGSQQFQLGHPDRYLLPYYERDIQKGVLTKEQARLLLDCLGIQINMRVPNGLSSGYMVGGTDGHGKTVANDLTELCLQVVGDIRLVYPAVGLCYTENMPQRYLEQACELLAKGCTHPAIFDDEVIVKGLMHYGVPEAEARNYIHSTCVEITPVGTSNVWVASPYTNLPQLLLDIMDREYPTFEALLEAYCGRLDEAIRRNFEKENAKRAHRAANSMNPLLSCFVNDCLERGLDIERGGARYNWIMPSFVGMANLVDSLYAIKTLVFTEKKLTMVQFKAVLDSDFEGSEALRQHILNRIPKYGNDLDDIDRYFGLLSEHILRECEQYSGLHSNARLIPSVFCWVMHERFDRERCVGCGRCAEACATNALEKCGEEMTAEEIIATVLRDEPFYKESGGGMTLSGGEPLLQFDLALALLRLAKEHGLHTALETSGHTSRDLRLLQEVTDLWLYDIKLLDDEAHRKHTGVSNGQILENLRLLDSLGASIVLRCPIIPGVNMDEAHFDALAELANSLKGVTAIHLEPYHPLGLPKAQQLGRPQAYENGEFLQAADLQPLADRLRASTCVEVAVI